MSYDKDYVLIGAGKIFYEEGGASINMGYYLGGVRSRLQKIKVGITKADVLGNYKSIKVGEKLIISTVLMETTIQNLWMAVCGYGSMGSYTDTDPLTIGGRSHEDPFQLRLIGKGPSGGTRTVTIYKVTVIDAGDQVMFAKRNTWVIPIKFEALHDTSRAIGDQLYSIVDSATPWEGF